MTEHHYETVLAWGGSTGGGYRGYDREHQVMFGSTSLQLSADPAFRGSAELPNPERLLLAAASSCQLLSFLALAALAGVDVVQYDDDAHAVMPEDGASTRITAIELRMRVTVRGTDDATVLRLVEEAHERCYIANSLSTRITVHPTVTVIA